MRGGKTKAGNAAATLNSVLVALRAADANGRIAVYERIERDHGAAFARVVKAQFEKSLRAKG